ncbi:ElyC/SanA/YdcF family protein [Paraflavisolibacter sp. H34]|uniref:YdcF family protein n=1 Tax=Huijunlia imazamoxiresistens TaxID=3127457 RepID=UPI00301A8C2E
MFFVLSKLLFFLVMPITLLLACFLISFFTKKEKARKTSLALGIGLLLFFTNPFLANEAWLWWEYPPVPVSRVPQYDAAIILTGVTSQNKSPHDRIYTHKGADRLLHPLQLYKEGRVKKFIITGGSGSLGQTYSTEAAEFKKILLQSCVPAEAILVEDKSRNTHENALFTRKLLQQQPQLKKLLLVTSAFHMRRAEGCFKKAGIRADVYPADFYSADRDFSLYYLLPQETSLAHWQKLFHEILGYVVYKVVGYA